jgi:hypothetical protein
MLLGLIVIMFIVIFQAVFSSPSSGRRKPQRPVNKKPVRQKEPADKEV